MATISGAELYRDILDRTGGDIYIGVVGPVRTGKSTFIKRFMDLMVIPNVRDEFERSRILDELPQSGSGRTVMTTQPGFVPSEAARISLDDDVFLNIRMVDCVGYMVDGALGALEEEQPRMVRTPWFDHEIPFDEAAEIGTKKVITEHSTIGIVVLTDGSITGIGRKSYESAEERVMEELTKTGKPYIILLNSTHPEDPETAALAEALGEKYSVNVYTADVLNMSEGDVRGMLSSLLMAFPMRSMFISMPGFITALGKEHPLMAEAIGCVRGTMNGLDRMRDAQLIRSAFDDAKEAVRVEQVGLDLGSGSAEYRLEYDQSVFYRVLSEECGCEIKNETALITSLKSFAEAKKEYDRVAYALGCAVRTGYGLVPPEIDAMQLEKPEIVQHGGRFGVRLKARSSGLHIIRVDIESEVSPLVGTAEQSEQLISYLTDKFEKTPEDIWSTNIFGKSLYDLVKEGMADKVERLPEAVQQRLREAITKMVNEGCRNLVCIML